MYIEVEISIDGNKSLKEASDIANKIHDSIERKYDSIKHCNIHIIPN